MNNRTSVSIILPHNADQVWSVIQDFGDYRWGEGVGPATTNADDPNRPGTVRRFSYCGHSSIQRLIAYDADTRSMSWESVEPFDETLSYYAATIRVLPVTITGQSFVEWSVEFDAAPDAIDRWREHQQREFRKSLERLSVYVGWALRGETG